MLAVLADADDTVLPMLPSASTPLPEEAPRAQRTSSGDACSLDGVLGALDGVLGVLPRTTEGRSVSDRRDAGPPGVRLPPMPSTLSEGCTLGNKAR